MKRWFISGVLVTAVLVLFIHAGFAQGTPRYPVYNDLYVNDFANILTSDTEAELRMLLRDLKTSSGIEATVVTINAYTDYDPAATSVEMFTTNLFNTWGVGSSQNNNGIMLLVDVTNRTVRIEVGTGYENTLNADMDDVIDEFIVPAFRNGDYDKGVLNGTRGIIQVVTGERPEVSQSGSNANANPPVRSQPPVYSAPDSSIQVDVRGTLPFVAGGAVGAAGIGTVLFRRNRRFRPRPCPHCQTQMVRLDESADDAHLDTGQQREESLGSVDYDVWQCPDCGTESIFDYSSLFSSYRACPKCRYHTLSINSRVIKPATYTSSGTREVTHTCLHCNHTSSHRERIPMKVRSTSSSSLSHSSSRSSFGGGRSSGGGTTSSSSSSHSSFGGGRSSGGSSTSSSSSSRSSFGGGRSSGGGASGKW